MRNRSGIVVAEAVFYFLNHISLVEGALRLEVLSCARPQQSSFCEWQIPVQPKGEGEEREHPKKEQTAAQAGCFP